MWWPISRGARVVGVELTASHNSAATGGGAGRSITYQNGVHKPNSAIASSDAPLVDQPQNSGPDGRGQRRDTAPASGAPPDDGVVLADDRDVGVRATANVIDPLANSAEIRAGLPVSDEPERGAVEAGLYRQVLPLGAVEIVGEATAAVVGCCLGIDGAAGAPERRSVHPQRRGAHREPRRGRWEAETSALGD